MLLPDWLITIALPSRIERHILIPHYAWRANVDL
jgi:hypothetical protein